MNFVKQIERLQKLNKLIKEENTGTPSELATKMNISRRKLYDLIESLKCLGADVVYERKNNTFCYKSQVEIEIRFSMRVLQEGETEKIFGGFGINVFSCFYPARSISIFDEQ